MMRKRLIAAVIAPALVAGVAIGGPAVAAKVRAALAPTATCTNHPTVTYANGNAKFTSVCTVPLPPTQTVTVTASPTDTPTPTPTPTPTDTPTPTPTPTDPPSPTDPPTSTPPANGWACTLTDWGNCPANGRGYDAQDTIPMSNGYNTYVANQSVGAGPNGQVTVNANTPGDWQAIANLPDYNGCGGCVQTYNHITQLTNDWSPKADGTPAWGNNSGDTDTPVDALSTLRFNYDETSPTGANDNYEFAADIWVDGYAGHNAPGSGDIMFWVDTKGRCNDGAYGPELLGHATLDGQNWTVHRWGGAYEETIFVLDGPGGPGTCAQQPSGSMPIKAGLAWLSANVPEFPAHPLVSNIDSGWEITEAHNATFTVHNYSITAN